MTNKIRFWHRSASHKLVIYMAKFLTQFSPFFQDFRHFLVSARRKFGLERFQPDWNKTRPRPSLIVSCYPWISTPEGWLGVSSQDENALVNGTQSSGTGTSQKRCHS